MRFLLTIALFLSSIFSFGQTKTSAPKKVACDCDSAIVLQIGKISQYGPTVPPPNAGKKNEITRTKTNPHVFENEHHTAWYVLVPLFSGDLSFTVIPQLASDDYDFVVYRYYGKSTCDSVANGIAKPVRSNIARTQNVSGGKTGLSADGKTEYAGEGPGKAFSKILPVKKGEKYLLVVDNVYDNGDGHTLKFAYMREVTINGEVANENGKHLKSDITLYDDSGKVIAATKSDSSGKYNLKATIVEQQNYSLVTSSGGTFPDVFIFNTKSLDAKTDSLQNLRTVLPQLKKGNKYKFSTINFVGDQAVVLPESVGTLRALYFMMKENPTLKIRIEGHVNGVGTGQDTAKFRKLSEARAEYVYNYLIGKGIDKSRLSWIGYGDRFMLYPQAKNEEELKLNRRVEISVVEL
jgi:outer membrane protein OmpA-like peptidoglycan-associated protein